LAAFLGFHSISFPSYTEAGTFRARHSQLPSLDIKCDRVSLFSLSGLGLVRAISPERTDHVISFPVASELFKESTVNIIPVLPEFI